MEMTDQFVRFSTGAMAEDEDKKLRGDLGAWPDRYWKAFPGVIKIIVKDYLNGEYNEKAYRAKLAAALSFNE
jgi:hypothetical protein